MDSLTQLVLGGAIGEAVVGKKEGNKAILWGAIFGTVPDLDIMLYPFIDDVQELAIHRGLSHSIVFAAGFALLMGRLLRFLYPHSRSSWHTWARMAFATLVTHAFLDAFTHYGTQLLQPFSNYPFSFDSISIIDPLYTLPLLVGVITALFLKPANPLRSRLNTLGLILSSLYLLLTLANKGYVTTVFHASLTEHLGSYERLHTNPTLFNNLLWLGIAEKDDTLYVGYYSLLDAHQRVTFERVPKHSARLAPYRSDPAVRRLLWFSKGYFTVAAGPNGLVFNDVRFPRSDLWLGDGGEYLFAFDLILNDDATQVVTFESRTMASGLTGDLWSRYVDRVLGRRHPFHGAGH